MKAIHSRAHPRAHLERGALLFAAWLVVFVVALNGLDGRAFQRLQSADFQLVGIAILFFLAAHLVSLINWSVFITASKIRFRFRRLAQILAVGLFVDHVLPPVAPGGEIAMGYLLSRDSRKPFSKTFATVTIHSVTWFVSFIGFTFLLLAYLIYQGRISNELTVLFALLLAGFAFLLWFVIHLALNPKLCRRVARAILARIYPVIGLASGGKLKKNYLLAWLDSTIGSFSLAFSRFLHERRLVFASCGFMVFHHLFYALSFFFVLSAFQVSIQPATAMAIYMFVSLVSLLSFVPGQLGVYEVTSILLVTLAGGSQAGVVALAIGVVRLIHYWLVVFGGGLIALKLGLEKLVPVKP